MLSPTAPWAAMVLAAALMAAPVGAQTPRDENWERCEARTPQRRVEGCTAVIRAGGERDAQLAAAHYNRGLAHGELGQYIEAIEDFDRVILLQPANAEAFNHRGTAYANRGHNDRAIQDYDQAIRLKPDFADAFNNRGFSWFAKGDLSRAIRDYDAAIRLVPGFTLALDNRGLAQLMAGRFDAAIADYTTSMLEDPTNATAYYGRGLARLRKGEKMLGERDISLAKRLDADIAREFEKHGLR